MASSASLLHDTCTITVSTPVKTPHTLPAIVRDRKVGDIVVMSDDPLQPSSGTNMCTEYESPQRLAEMLACRWTVGYAPVLYFIFLTLGDSSSLYTSTGTMFPLPGNAWDPLHGIPHSFLSHEAPAHGPALISLLSVFIFIYSGPLSANLLSCKNTMLPRWRR